MKEMQNITVEVKKMPEITVAYLRHIGPFKGETTVWTELFGKITRWAGSRGYLRCPGSEYFTVFRDDLNISNFTEFKADVCVSVDAETKAEGEVGVTTIPSGKYATAQFEISADEYEAAWTFMFQSWLPQSGFQPDDRCCFEKYLNNPKLHPKNRHIIELSIPVIPL